MTSLTSLTDRELAVALHELAGKERASTIEILVHLAEFERRDLHLRLGYPSMFEYCTRGLGYSESSAVRRLQTARMARRFPEVYGAIERKELTVVTASMLSSVVTRENVSRLIEAARGKLQREVKGIVAAICPTTVVIPDRVIPLAVPVPAPEVLSIMALGSGGSNEQDTDGRAGPNRQDSYRHNGGKNSSTFGDAAANVQSTCTHPVGPPPTEKRFKFEFGAGKEFMKKFSRVQSLMSNKIPVRMTFEVLFECLMDEYLDRNDPEKRAERREIRRSKTDSSQTGENPQITRHIPTAVRDNVYTRDNGRCTFTGPSDVRCSSTRNLQIDHVKPFALGGGNDASNLRLLCARHNLLQAKRTFGADQVSSYQRRE